MTLDLKTIRQNIYQLADIERASAGKTYPAGCSTIELSAYQGAAGYLTEPSEVSNRYAVIIPKVDISHRYLHTILEEALPEFLAKYQTGINLQEGTLKYLNLEIHTSRDTQEWLSDRLEALSEAEDKIQREINGLKELKTFFLEKLFIN